MHSCFCCLVISKCDTLFNLHVKTHKHCVTVIFCGCSLMACEYACSNVLAQARRECGGPSRSDIISGCWATNTQTQTHPHTPTHTWAAGLEWLCSKGCRLWLTPWTWHPHCPGRHMSPRHTLLAQKKLSFWRKRGKWKWMKMNPACPPLEALKDLVGLRVFFFLI